MLRALPRVALQLWIVLFIVFFGAEVIHLEPGLRVLTQLLYGVPLAVLAAWRLRGPVDRLDWAVLGLLGIYALVCLVSRDRTESLGTLGLATAYAAWFGLTRRAGDLRGPIILAISTGLALTLAFNGYLAVREKVDWYVALGAAPLEGVVNFPWESVNTLPVLVLLAIASLAWLPAGGVRSALALVVGLSAIVVIPVSQGRAGYAGLLVAAGVLLALQPTSGRFIRRADARGKSLVAAGAAVAVAVVFVLVGPRFADAMATSGRLLIWEQGWNMVGGAPLVGSGPGVYSWVRLEFPPAAADLIAVRLLHSVPLLMLVEGGVLLLVAGAIALGAWVATAARGATAWGFPERVTAAALAGFATASVLDDFSFLPTVTAIVLALAAFITPVAASPSTTRARWLMPAALAVATVASLPGIVAVDVARAAAQEGRTAMVAGDHAGALDAFERATSAHPQNGGYWLGLGMAAAYAGDADRAAAAYLRSTEAAPGDPRGHAALAALLPAEEVEHLRHAAERTLDDPQYAARLGLALATSGDVAGATEAWASAVAIRPEILRLLPYDEAGLFDADVASDAQDIIRAEPRPAPSENDAAIWDIGLAMNALPAGSDPAWRAVHAARHGDLDMARSLADEAVAAAPTQARGYQARAAVAAFACDADAERRALALERHALGAYVEPDPEPRSMREFVYREASLGPSQPPGARLPLRIERWPWSLVDRPECGP